MEKYLKYKAKYMAKKLGLVISVSKDRPNYRRQRSSVEQVGDIYRKELKTPPIELEILQHIKNFITDDSKKKHFVQLADVELETIEDKTFIRTVTVNGTKYTQYLLFSPAEIRQIINIFKILATFGIYEKDMNPENFIVRGDTVVKIDFGGIENKHKTLFEASDSLLDSEPDFKAKLLTETDIEELEMVNPVLDDTNLYGIDIERDPSKPSLTIQKFIYGTMFLQLKNKIDSESFTLEEPIAESKKEILEIIRSEYENPSFS